VAFSGKAQDQTAWQMFCLHFLEMKMIVSLAQ
jgi:hypothetical protein